MIRYVWPLVALLVLGLPSCGTAPLDRVADRLVEAETREEREMRINGFSAIAAAYAVDTTPIGDAADLNVFLTRLTAALDRLKAEPIWVETEIREIVTLFATGFKDRIDTSGFFSLIIGVGIPSIGDMLDAIGDVAIASAMLRDVRGVMKQVKAEKMTPDEANAAFRARIEREAAAIRRLVGDSAPAPLVE